jgi:hypothetical protein
MPAISLIIELLENRRGRDHWADLNLDEKHEYTLRKNGVRMRIGFVWPRIGSSIRCMKAW